MSSVIEVFGEKIRVYVSPHDTNMSFGGICLRTLAPMYGSILSFLTAVSPSILHDGNRTPAAPGLALLLQLSFGVAVALFCITPPAYFYRPGAFSVRQLLHRILLAALPILGAYYLIIAGRPFHAMSNFGVGYFVFFAACLFVTTILLWALQPAKWVAQK